MIRLAATAAFVVALAAASPAQARIVPGKGMAGVAVGMAEAEVLAKLGAPDRRRTASDDFGPSVRLRYDDHGGLRMILRPGASGDYELFQVTTRGRAERTRKGVGVGSSERRLRRRLKGERCQTVSGYRSCSIGAFEPGRVVTDFRIRRRHVVSVVVGRVVD